MKHSDVDLGVAKARKTRAKIRENVTRDDFMPPPSEIPSRDTVTRESIHSNPNTNSGGSSVYNSRDNASKESAYSSSVSREATLNSNFAGTSTGKNPEWLPAAVVLNACENEGQNGISEAVSTRRGSLPAGQGSGNPPGRQSIGKPNTEDNGRLSLGNDGGQKVNHVRTQSVQLVDPTYGDENR